jgi:hypothetical protein
MAMTCTKNFAIFVRSGESDITYPINLYNMAEKKLSELNLDELKAKEKAFKQLLALMGLAIAIMLGCGIYLTFKKGFNTFTVLPLAFLGILMPIVSGLKNVRNEIKSRQG